MYSSVAKHKNSKIVVIRWLAYIYIYTEIIQYTVSIFISIEAVTKETEYEEHEIKNITMQSNPSYDVPSNIVAPGINSSQGGSHTEGLKTGQVTESLYI